MSELYRIAIYLRLSKEDDNIVDESNSITNQRLMLKGYIRKKFEHYELTEFVDDGFTGTNFNRPALMDLLSRIREGKHNCIIVKDFSRFSRDYIELGSYLDQIFPSLGVRFISVNDNYDSKEYSGSTADFNTSFKGLMYDLYSKDLSAKVKSALKTRKEQGQYVSANCPFGYDKDPKDRHMLVIADDEAIVVKRIFGLAQIGMTSIKIAKILNQEEVKTPIEYKIEKKKTQRIPKGDKFQWNSSIICNILKNQVYTGDIVYDKYYRDSVGGKNHIKPKSEWKIYYNHHEAIISRNVFDEIQQRRRTVFSPDKEKQTYLLTGKAVCGCCKKSLELRKKGRNPYFYCPRKYYYRDSEQCVSKINLVHLEEYILYRMKEVLIRQEETAILVKNKESELQKKKNHLSITEITKETVDRFISLIIVYDEQNIEIRWKMAGASD